MKQTKVCSNACALSGLHNDQRRNHSFFWPRGESGTAGQILEGSFSAVSTPNFQICQLNIIKASFESSCRDRQNIHLSTDLRSQFFNLSFIQNFSDSVFQFENSCLLKNANIMVEVEHVFSSTNAIFCAKNAFLRIPCRAFSRDYQPSPPILTLA